MIISMCSQTGVITVVGFPQMGDRVKFHNMLDTVFGPQKVELNLNGSLDILNAIKKEQNVKNNI